MQSIIKERSPVTFPRFIGERVYMRPFFQSEDLPSDLLRWQLTVDAMLDGVATDGPIYLMIDQGAVGAGIPHRRPGVHIDGYWEPNAKGDWNDQGGRWNDIGAHSIPGEHIAEGSLMEEAILLASTVAGCQGYVGSWHGLVGKGGDCSHIDLTGLTKVKFKPNQCYAGNVTALHESLPVPHDCLRTLVRLNVPGHVVR